MGLYITKIAKKIPHHLTVLCFTSLAALIFQVAIGFVIYFDLLSPKDSMLAGECNMALLMVAFLNNFKNEPYSKTGKIGIVVVSKFAYF